MKFKRFVGFVLSFIILAELLLCMPITTYANSNVDSGIFGSTFRWFLDENETLTIRGNGYITGFDFQTDSDYEVYEAIWNAKRIVIGEGIKNIYENFLSETQAVSILLPSTLERIESNGIGGENIKSLHIPKNLHIFGVHAINCPNLRRITVDSESPYFTSVSGVLYSKDKKTIVKYPPAMPLTTYTIPEGVTKIATDAFYDSNLNRVIMPDTVVEMGPYAFAESRELNYIRLSNNLESISGAAFAYCYSLTSITIPDSVETLVGSTFQSCKNLSYVRLSNNLIHIGSSAFANCPSLRNIYLPSSIREIDSDAFAHSGLQEINIPSNVVTLSSGLFSECQFLNSVSLPNTLIKIESNAFKGCISLTSVNIPDSVSEMGVYVFSECENLVSVHLPSNITKIPRGTFSRCYKLSAFNFPYGIEVIEAAAFYSCKSLTAVALPDLKVIEEGAFSLCSNLHSIFIPITTTNIGQSAFNQTGLNNVIYWGTTDRWSKITIESGNIPLLRAYKGYTINFYMNDGSGNLYSSEKYAYGEFIYPPTNPTRDGYIFAGWYANSKCTGESFIDVAGNSKRKATNSLSLYAKWIKSDYIIWGTDTFKFGNINYFWGNKYKISDEYYNILTKDLGAYDKFLMGIQKNKDFGGSCYGMSVAMAMFKQGLMTPHFVWNGAENVHELPYPKNDMRVASLINYYQLSQSLPSISKKLNNQSKMGTKYLAKELVNALWNINNTGIPVVMGYEYKDGNKWYRHAVLAYKVEEDGLYYKIHIADPNNLAHSDLNADSFVVIEDTEPSYMYIDNDWSNISYKGAEGSHSFADNTFKLFCVLDDNSLYQSINIQEKLTNQCMGTSNYSLMLASLDETTAAAHLGVNFDEFSIGNGLENTTISKDGINGDLEISDGTSNYGDNYVSYDLLYSKQYTVTPSVELDGGYESTIIFEDDYATFMSAKSEKIATFDFSNNGMLKILSDVKCNKTISYSAQNNEWLFGGIEVSANVNSLELEVLEEGRYHIKSSSSLKDAVVSIIDLDGNKTSVVVSDDVLEFIFTYSQSEQQYVISFEGTNNDDQITKTNTVVFYTNGGSTIESISDIEYGDKIMEPQSPIYEGFIFGGWYIDEAFTTEWDFENDVVTDNLVLYAKWEEDPSSYHIVSFNNGKDSSKLVVPHGYILSDSDYPDLPVEEGYIYYWDIVSKEITEDIDISIIKKPVEKVFYMSYVNISYEGRNAKISLNYNSQIDDAVKVKVSVYKENELISEINSSLPTERNEAELVISLPSTDTSYSYTIQCFDAENKELDCSNGYFYAEKKRYSTDEYIYSLNLDDSLEILSYTGNNSSVLIPSQIDNRIVSTIASEAFSSDLITSITIPNSIVSIGKNAFGNCPYLSDIIVATDNNFYSGYEGNLYNKNGSELIQYSPANNNFSVAFTLPTNTEVIVDGAFSGSVLEEIILSSSINSISGNAFSGCTNLTNIFVNEGNEKYSSVDGVLYSKDKKAIVFYPMGKSTNYYCIEKGTEIITSDAFINGELQFLSIPASLKTIENNAFRDFYVSIYLYCGDENSWSNISIDENEDLEYWDIRYNYNPDFRIDAEIVSAVDDGDVVSITLNYNYSYQAHNIFVAIYDKEGRFIDITNDVFYEWDEPGELSFDFENGENFVPYKVKVFFFESINTIKPLRTTLEAEITKNNGLN